MTIHMIDDQIQTYPTPVCVCARFNNPWVLLFVVWQAFVHTPDKYSCIDMFAGQARISKAFAESNYGVCTLDFSRDGSDDSQLI